MDYEVIIGDRTAEIGILEKNGNSMKIAVDDIEYQLDVMKTGAGVYSILWKGKSYDIDVVPGNANKKYIVASNMNEYDVEVVDAESRYIKSRKGASDDDAGNVITSPMPGKVVKIPVSIGEEVEAGQTVIIVSAMKMESEFKAKSSGKVKTIPVKEGDTVNTGEVLVVVE